MAMLRSNPANGSDHGHDRMAPSRRWGPLSCMSSFRFRVVQRRDLAEKYQDLFQIQRRRHVRKLNVDIDLARINLRAGAFVVHHHAGKCDDQGDGNQLDENERNRSPINLAGCDPRRQLARHPIAIRFLGGHGPQIEQRESEWRMHERSLHVHAKDHTEPDEVDAEFLGGGTKQRDDDEGEFEKVEEKREHEHEGIYEDKKAYLSAGKGNKQIFDPAVAVDAVKGQRKNPRSDKNEDHEG